MFDALLATLVFSITLLGIFWLPGWLLFRFWLEIRPLTTWELLVLSFALSIGLLDMGMLTMDALDIPITAYSIIGSVGTLLILFIGSRLLSRWWKIKRNPTHTLHTNDEPEELHASHFTRREGWLFLSMCFIMLALQTMALSETTLPTATDLGHHMYWVKSIVLNHDLPHYVKTDLVTLSDGTVTLGDPHPIADFIVGEHLPLAALALISGQDVTSAFPTLFLSIIHLLSIFATLILVWRIGNEFYERFKSYRPAHLVLGTFFLLGPLFALASPHMKFVTGGVIGNLFGNLFIPLVLWAFFRAFHEKKFQFFGLGIFFSFLLAYTHHLSTLVLVFILIGIVIAMCLLKWTAMKRYLTLLWDFLKRPPLILLFLVIIGFVLFIAVPSYLDSEAIGSALGTPTKTTRTGLSFYQLTTSIGLAKVAFGCAGLVLLLSLALRTALGSAVLVGWTSILLVMTLFPHLLLLDIPSNRIGSYLVYPLACTAALIFLWIPMIFRRANDPQELGHSPLALWLYGIGILVVLGSNGWYENGNSYPDRSYQAETLLETKSASDYLARFAPEDALILKDHNYLVGDSWMKLSFMRDYNFPLSRGFFSRYTEGGSRREHCTLLMISAPNTPEGERCFESTHVRYLVVNPKIDSAQFEKSASFSKVFTSASVSIYERRAD